VRSGVELLPYPTKFSLFAGDAEGPVELNAFDAALLKAGIANVNLLKISSILPPGAEYCEKLEIPEGSLVPTAFGTIVSGEQGDLIAAAVSVGRSKDGYGVIMEYAGRATKEEAASQVKQMVEHAFKVRGLALDEVMVKSVDHVVERIGCAFAAVALWY
jgi:arginine decarboxylase